MLDGMNLPNRLTISCDDCTRRTLDCRDCVVTSVLDADGEVRADSDALVIDLADARVIGWMNRAGLLPDLRFDQAG